MAEDGVVLVGTLRANGWPRISPVEPLVVGRPALPRDDVAVAQGPWTCSADPRCVVHTTVPEQGRDRRGRQDLRRGAVEVDDRAERERYCVGPGGAPSAGAPRAISTCSWWT